MNRFEKQLEKWNNGILRGAQAKLAKCLHVTTATVALWATGKRHPSKGYIAKMSELFSLDEYSVTRLFADTGSYVSNPYFPFSNSSSLCDKDNFDFTPTSKPQLNQTVSLPVFAKLPPAYPHFISKQVRAWWTMPTREAQNVNFLFLLPTPYDPSRLLFVQARSTWENGKIMLCKSENRYLLVAVTRQNGSWNLKPFEEKASVLTQATPLGVVKRQICVFLKKP